MKTSYRARVAGAVAAAFLAEGAWSRAALVARGALALGRAHAWLPALAARVVAHFQDRVQLRALARFVAAELASSSLTDDTLHVRRWLAPATAMGSPRWPVPALSTPGELARWLDLTPNELVWFADARGLERLAAEPLRHYTYRWVSKRADGSGGARLLEAPKARIKALQRKILREILDLIAPHDACHGFRRGRSVRTHAAAHAARQVVLRLDLADFFLSISAARVTAVFRAAGYPDEVAHTLAMLCTNRAPVMRHELGPWATDADLRAWRLAETLARTRHLPQGAPTSPAIANLCAYRLDVRLAAAAKEAGAAYTRYADDLVFSGDALGPRVHRFAALAAAVAQDEGFAVNHRKTRIMRAGGRQSVTGLVVNADPGVPREAYDRIKALLHNCARHGPETQNRAGHPDFRAHVRGLVAWVAMADPRRGARLDEAFARVRW